MKIDILNMQVINMWNNRHELILISHPIHIPLFHTKRYMKWYMTNLIYFFINVELLNYPQTQQNPSEPTFLVTNNYYHQHADINLHVNYKII